MVPSMNFDPGIAGLYGTANLLPSPAVEARLLAEMGSWQFEEVPLDGKPRIVGLEGVNEGSL